MVAKLVTHGANREQAIDAMRQALDSYWIRGIETNIPFLAAVIAHPRFRRGELTTHFIDEEYPQGFSESHLERSDVSLFLIVAAVVHRRFRDRAASISGQLVGHERHVPNDWIGCIGDDDHPLSVRGVEGESNSFDVVLQDAEFRVRSNWQFGDPIFSGTVNGEPLCVQVERQGLRYRLSQGGARVDVLMCTPTEAAMLRLMPHKEPPDLSAFVLSPMPGLLLSIAVQAGDEVKAGQEIAVIEAMKMENVLRAERDSTVKTVFAAAGDHLSVDQKIVEFE